MSLVSINPFTEKIIKNFDEYSVSETESIIIKTDAAQNKWRKTDFSFRKNLMLKAAKILKEKSRKYAEILTLEMGKPIKQAVAEVEKCAWVCEYYGENAETMLAKEIIKTDASESYVRFDPLGVVLAVMPWNFPFWQVFRFAAPALMAGNGAVLKHASNVSLSALAIEEIFKDAGFPDNLFRTLLIGSSKVKNVIDNPLIKATTLTGSEYAGKKVGCQSGENLKKSVLELGGSDPFILLKDADLDKAVDGAVLGRLINNGQSCIAAKRFIAVKDVYNEFVDKFVIRMESVNVGDPMKEETELGPIAREDLLIELLQQIKTSKEFGAEIAVGGNRIDGTGYFIEPTVITNIKPESPAYNEELFGPVASVILAEDEEDAVRIANDSQFGLGASLWTRDTENAKRIATNIESGSVFINGIVKSDPRLPFGGIKLSGYGRELSHYGIKEFVNIKTVWVK